MLRRTKQNRRPARRSSEDALRGYAPRMISGLQRCSRLTVSAYFSPHGGKLRTLSSGKIPISFRLYAANKSGFRFQVKALGGRVPTLEQMEPALSMKQKDWCKSPAAKSVAAFDVSRMLFGDAPPRRECHEHRRSPHHHYLLSARQLRRHRRVGPGAWRRRLVRHLAERSPPSRLRVALSADSNCAAVLIGLLLTL